MTPGEATPLANAYLTALRGEPCAVFAWSAREARTHWRFFWNTVAATEGRAQALKGVDEVAVDKRSGVVLLDPKRPPRAVLNFAFPAPPRGRIETETEAFEVAQSWLDATQECWSSLTTVKELPYGWAFSWDSDAYLATGDALLALGGNGPLVVLRATGELFALGTAHGFEAECAGFEREVLGRS